MIIEDKNILVINLIIFSQSPQQNIINDIKTHLYFR